MGNSFKPSGPKDPPKPTTKVLNVLIAGLRAPREKNENPHPSSISSNLQDLPSSEYKSCGVYDGLHDFLSVVSLSCCRRCLQPLVFRDLRSGFLHIT